MTVVHVVFFCVSVLRPAGSSHRPTECKHSCLVLCVCVCWRGNYRTGGRAESKGSKIVAETEGEGVEKPERNSCGEGLRESQGWALSGVQYQIKEEEWLQPKDKQTFTNNCVYVRTAATLMQDLYTCYGLCVAAIQTGNMKKVLKSEFEVPILYHVFHYISLTVYSA